MGRRICWRLRRYLPTIFITHCNATPLGVRAFLGDTQYAFRCFRLEALLFRLKPNYALHITHSNVSVAFQTNPFITIDK